MQVPVFALLSKKADLRFQAEMDRLDLIHEIFRLRLEGKLYLAPIDNPKRILDIGTGTGKGRGRNWSDVWFLQRILTIC